jgi:membrane associated rhomboid family serine protease
MGLYDRDYYRDRSGRVGSLSRWSGNTWLIVINIAVFALQVLIFAQKHVDLLSEYGHFSTYKISWEGGLQFWRFVTFQFLHAGYMHVGFNMLGLYIFGGMVEEHLGRKKYLAFYLTCGIFGALMYLILNAAGYFWVEKLHHSPIPGLLFNSLDTRLVGASAGVLGVIMACAYIAPQMQVQLLFPPVVLRMKTLAYFYVGLAILTLIFGGHNAGGEAAHLGGAIAGAFFIRNSHLLRDFFDVFTDSRKHNGRGARPMPPSRSRAEREAEEAEIDRILAKVREQGVNSLSEAEKATLRRDTDMRRASR